MIKAGNTLFACFAGGRWFVKQAKSERQFARMCVADELAGLYHVPSKRRSDYMPDFMYDEKDKIWRWADGRPYGKSLPPGARRSRQGTGHPFP